MVNPETLQCVSPLSPGHGPNLGRSPSRLLRPLFGQLYFSLLKILTYEAEVSNKKVLYS